MAVQLPTFFLLRINFYRIKATKKRTINFIWHPTCLKSFSPIVPIVAEKMGYVSCFSSDITFDYPFDLPDLVESPLSSRAAAAAMKIVSMKSCNLFHQKW